MGRSCNLARKEVELPLTKVILINTAN